MIVHARGYLEADRCLVMGIINRTPDSFYDGGRMDLGAAVALVEEMVAAGTDILDLGGVPAGPQAFVSEDEELARLIPLIHAIAALTDVPMSVETGRAEVARAALGEGAAIINDVTGAQDQALLDVCASTGAGLVLMHHGGQIRGRPRHPRYEDVIASIKETWAELAARAHDAGIRDDALMVDPGLDFGKTTFHSLEIMRRLDELTAVPWPVLVAPSHKDVVGETLDLPVDDRIAGTLALVALSVTGGARIVRVHDVRAAVQVVHMVEAVLGRRAPAAPVRGLWL